MVGPCVAIVDVACIPNDATLDVPFLLGVALVEGLLLHCNDWRKYLLVVGATMGVRRLFQKTKVGNKRIGVEDIGSKI